MKKNGGMIILIATIFLNPYCNSIPEKKSAAVYQISLWSEQDSKPIVRTKYGYVEAVPDRETTWAWKSIPYASPPVKELRWKAPRKPQAWQGVRKVYDLEKSCTQFVPFLRTYSGSEDCLYLNIWRPKTSETNLPVYVWVHGGGNSIGSAMMTPEYAGHGVASRSNMIFVSINYRLGPFGWFYHKALHDGVSPEDDSGNYGTLDIIEALRWVNENIEAFGGDSRNVVVAGESAGSMNALSLLLSPPAKGLFSKVICESGGPVTNTPEKSAAFADNLIEDLLVRDHRVNTKDEARIYLAAMSKDDIRKFLSRKTSLEVISALAPKTLGMASIPTILTDGHVIIKEGYKAFETGKYPGKVPIMIGTNKDEAKLFLYFSNLSWQSETYQTINKYASAKWKARSVDSVSEALSMHTDQPGVYAYEFTWGSTDDSGRSSLPGDWGKKLGSFHSAEIPFFLGTVAQYSSFLSAPVYTSQNLEERKLLSSAIMKYTKSFVISGNPNPEDQSLPEWTSWQKQPGYMVLDARTEKVSGQQLQLPKIGINFYMKNTILKEEMILQKMKDELSPEMYQSVLRYMQFVPFMDK